jgi:AraC-like DNA-binding protein
MENRYIFSNSQKGKTEFELKNGVKPWDIFFFLKKGKIEVSFDNEESIIVNEGQVVFFENNVKFKRRIIEKIDFFQVGIMPSEKQESWKLSHGVLNVSEKVFNVVLSMLCRVEGFLENKNNAYIRAIDFLVCEHYANSAKNLSDYKVRDADVLHVIQYFQQNLSEKINIKALASSLGLTHNGLIYKFKNQTGVTPIQFLTRFRLQYSKQLLSTTDMRINEIAFAVGFYDAYYFSNAFKKYYGVSPLKFKNQTEI